MHADDPHIPDRAPSVPPGLQTWLLADGGARARELFRDFGSRMDDAQGHIFPISVFLKPLSDDDRIMLLVTALETGHRVNEVVAALSTFTRTPAADTLDRLRHALVVRDPFGSGVIQAALAKTAAQLDIVPDWGVNNAGIGLALDDLDAGDKGLILYLELARGGSLWPDVFEAPLSASLLRNIKEPDVRACLAVSAEDDASALAQRIGRLGDRVLLSVFAHLPGSAVARMPEETMTHLARTLAHTQLNDAVHARARDHLLLHAPLSAELTGYHAEKLLALCERLRADPDGDDASRYADAYANWHDYDDAQREGFLNFHAGTLARLYDAPFTPPVSLVDSIPGEGDIMGMQTAPRSLKAIHENAFGKTSLVRRHVRDDFAKAVGMQTHEFFHGWENWMCARLLLRESGRLSQRDAHNFPVVVRDTWQRDCALLFAFNQQATSPLTLRGHYFDVDSNGPHYQQQVRERHARHGQNLYETLFMDMLGALARHRGVSPRPGTGTGITAATGDQPGANA